jgi:hypothetical protein
MAAYAIINKMTLLGTTWSAPSTAPGVIVPLPTIAGTISSASDISAYVRGGGEPAFNTEMKETTNQASGGYKNVIPGITSGDDLVFECNSDQAASSLDVLIRSTLGGISRAGASPIYVDIKGINTARAVTNPSFVAAVYISKWAPIMGATGDVVSTQLVLTVTGQFGQLTA